MYLLTSKIYRAGKGERKRRAEFHMYYLRPQREGLYGSSIYRAHLRMVRLHTIFVLGFLKSRLVGFDKSTTCIMVADVNLRKESTACPILRVQAIKIPNAMEILAF